MGIRVPARHAPKSRQILFLQPWVEAQMRVVGDVILLTLSLEVYVLAALRQIRARQDHSDLVAEKGKVALAMPALV